MLTGKATDSGVTVTDSRWFLEAVPWRTRTGSPQRDLPEHFDNWKSVFERVCGSGSTPESISNPFRSRASSAPVRRADELASACPVDSEGFHQDDHAAALVNK